MTDVLLAHSFFLRFDPKQWRTMQPYAPLGTLYAAAYLREHGYNVAVFDSMLAQNANDITPLLQHHRPRAVVFYEDSFNWLSKMCLTRMRDACFEMMKLVRAQLGREVPIIIAGSDATDHREVYFARGADYVLLGEGEVSLLELVERLFGKSTNPLGKIAGVALPDNGAAIPRGFQKNLDVFPFPAWDLLEVEKYRAAWKKKHGYYSVNLVTTRGCPFRCNWCAKPIYGDRYNSRSPENVVEEMLWLRRNFQPDHIWFADDIFGLKPGWVEKFGEAAQAANAAMPFKIQARVDLLHEDAVVGLRNAGCKTAWVGAESGSQKILEAMDKGTTVEQIYATAKRLQRHGIEVCFFLQFGYPGETEEDIEKTIRMVRECNPHDIGISVSYPLPGTRFYERVKNEMSEKHNWEHSDDLALMFRGEYQPAFYRQLHRVVHHEFRLQQARALFDEMRRRPSQLTVSNIRRVLAATLRRPLLGWEHAKLQRLKIPQSHVAEASLPAFKDDFSE